MGRSALGNPNHAALIATAESAMMLSPDQGVADTINSTIGLLVCGETPHTPYERSISQKTAIYGMQWRLPAREGGDPYGNRTRTEEHTSELQSLMRTPYAVSCLKKKKNIQKKRINH